MHAGGATATSRPRVLLTLPDRPHPADGGKRRRAAATLRGLAALDIELDVVVLMAGPPLDDPLPPGLQVHRVLQVDAEPRHVLTGLAATAVRRVPWQIAVERWGAVRAAMRPLTSRPYDLVWFGATDHAVSLHRSVRAGRTVVDMDDVEVPKLRALLSLPTGSGTVSKLDRVQRRIELPLWSGVQRRVAQIADVIVVCSRLDRQRVGAGPDVMIVPNGYVAGSNPVSDRPADPPTVLFVGTYSYPPNVDAAVFAATRVLPLLRAQRPDVRLRLVGRDAGHLPAELGTLPGVEVIGAVAQMDEELARASVSIVPVRYGGGTRVKILESWAFGVPVVSTRLGCEGLDAVDGEHLLVADDAEALAAGCIRLINEPSTAARLAAAGRILLVDRFSEEHVSQAVRDVVARVLPAASVQPTNPGSAGS